MATDRELPLVARNFRVRVSILGPKGGRVAESEVACSEVVLPRLRLGRHTEREHADDTTTGGEPVNLVLGRGHTGSPEFYEWWRAERDSERDRLREVMIALLDERHEPVTEWRFTGCRIVSLDYTPFDALARGVVVERLELSFEQVEQLSPGR